MYVWKPPHINNSSFDKSAQKLFVRNVSLVIDLKTSAPPKKVTSPNITAMCINRDLLFSNNIANSPHKNNGRPRREGMYEVKDWLSLTELTNMPQTSNIIPITAVIFSALCPKNVNSLSVIPAYLI
tara:strand:- start:121 stop:498 length:378 start_codon:yes stop_codon:yes gene_type:complete